jgi:hypothetical protein
VQMSKSQVVGIKSNTRRSVKTPPRSRKDVLPKWRFLDRDHREKNADNSEKKEQDRSWAGSEYVCVGHGEEGL